MRRSARESRHGVIELLAALAVLGTYATLYGMLASPVATQTRVDVEGGHDHPLLPRYRGSSPTTKPRGPRPVRSCCTSASKATADACVTAEVFLDCCPGRKAELKPESKAELDRIARSLANEPALRVFIVGHTDNQGSVNGNIDLSQRRAEAVVAAPVHDYRIDAKRLVA